MDSLTTLEYSVDGRVARITLNRPHRGNAINNEMPREISECVVRANIDPRVHVIALAGNGTGLCGGYDLELYAQGSSQGAGKNIGDKSPLSREVQARNHDPAETWDPMTDYALMHRNVKHFMSLFHSEKPVVCKVHGFCVAGGTDLALCSDLLVIEDKAKIGYPPARVWGSPTTSMWIYRLGPEKAKRLLLTGDCLSGAEAVDWGLAIECAPAASLDERFEILLERIARQPINQLVMMKLLVNQTLMNMGLQSTQLIGTVFDGITRHTREGYAFQQLATEKGFREAVRQRDEPMGDLGLSTYKDRPREKC